METALINLAALLVEYDPDKAAGIQDTVNVLRDLTITLDRINVRENGILEQFENMKKAYATLSCNMKSLNETYAGGTVSTVFKDAQIRAALAPIMELAAQEYEQSRFALYRILSGMSHSQFGDTIFEGAITLLDASRRFRRASLYFGNEMLRGEEERVHMRKIMMMLTAAVEEKRNNVFDEETMVMVAEEHFKGLFDCKAILAYLENSGLKEREIVVARGLNPDEYSLLDKVPTRDAARQHAVAAAKLFQVLVQNADEDYMTVRGAENQIKYRRNIAECFYHVGFDADAQLYLIGAIHLAHEQNNETEKRLLETKLREVKDKISPSMYVQPARLNLRPPRGALPAENVEQTEANDHRLWLALHTTRSESRIVQYCTSQEEIVAAQFAANFTRIKGIALMASVAAVPSIITGTTIALAPAAVATFFAASPLGLIGLGAVAVVSIASAIHVGINLIHAGQDMMNEPNLRMNLNALIRAAMSSFQQGQFTEFMEKLASDYGIKDSPRHLFVFDKRARLAINSEKIIDTLLGHGFRPDGIAYILNVLAEALTSSQIKFDQYNSQNTGTHLRALAVDIFHIIIHNEPLRDEADRLDERILENTLDGRIHQLMAYLSTVKDGRGGRIIGGIPENYYHDEEAAPFFARLEEMRNNARMNYAILEVIEGKTENLTNAARLLLQVQKSPYSQFRYFTVSDHRVHTIKDLTSAFNISVTDEDRESTHGEGRVDPMSVNTIVLGRLKVNVTAKLQLSESSSIFDFFRHFGVDVSRSTATERLHKYIDADTQQRQRVYTCPLMNMQSVSEVPIGAVAAHAVYLYRELTSLSPREHSVMTLSFLLHSRRFPVLEIMFETKIIRCTIGEVGGEHAFVCLDDIRLVQNLPRTVFVYSPEYYSQADENVSIVPSVAVASNSTEFVPVPCGDAGAFLHAGSIQFNEYSRVRSEREKRHALFAAHEEFERAVRTESSMFLNLSASISDEVTEAFLLLAECKIELHKLTAAQTLLQTHSKHEKFKDHWRYWYLLAKTHRKLFDYRAASACIHKASRILNDEVIQGQVFVVQRELALLEKLRPLRMIVGEGAHAESLHAHCAKHFKYSLPKQVTHEEKRVYNVLCIDGGGIKGIIACYILAEIERRSGVAIRHLFQHIAGTSTGAIIAGALALPHEDPDKQLSPKYTAYEILEMYTDPEKAGLIFKPSFNYFGIFGARYDPDGRAGLVRKFYGSASFDDATVQLSLLAGDESRGNDTIVFSKETHPSLKLLDAVMASSAAPTYFPAYKINGASYIDGGLTANNPSRFAYHAAQKLIKSKPIRILSLGCGDVMTEFTEHNQGAVHYVKEAPSQAMSAQQLTADHDMTLSLNKDYYLRWQPLFEKLSGLDVISEDTLRLYVETAKQFIFENEDSIERLIKALKVMI